MRPLRALPQRPVRATPLQASRTVLALPDGLLDHRSAHTLPLACADFPDEPGNPSSVRPIKFVRRICLRDEIVEYGDSIFGAVTTEAIDSHFRIVIEQFQPKQRNAVKGSDLRPSNHAYLTLPYRGQQNRRFRTIFRNRREPDVSLRDLQFGKRPSEGVAASQISKSSKGTSRSEECRIDWAA